MRLDKFLSDMNMGTRTELKRDIRKGAVQVNGEKITDPGFMVNENDEIIFAGEDEIIKISHSARSRALFANGAINGARFIKDKENGLYDMDDLLRG